MNRLMEDLQDLVEQGQVAVRAALPELVMRMQKSVDAQLLRALEIASVLANYEAASALATGNYAVLNQIGLRRVAMGHYDLAFEACNSAFHLRNDRSGEDAGYAWSLAAYLKPIHAMDVSRDQVWGRLRALLHCFLSAVARNGLFTRQATMPPRAFPPKLVRRDILLDTDGRYWSNEVQLKPTMGGDAVAVHISEKLAQASFEMSCVCLIDDRLPRECIGGLPKSRPALRHREAVREIAQCRGFVPL